MEYSLNVVRIYFLLLVFLSLSTGQPADFSRNQAHLRVSLRTPACAMAGAMANIKAPRLSHAWFLVKFSARG